MSRVLLALTGALVVFAAGCGRTAEARTAYPCFFDLSGDCTALAEVGERVRKDYLDEVQGPADAVRAADIGACHRSVVEQQLALRCLPDRCATLCDFHPCAVRDDAVCEDRCDDVIGTEPDQTTALEPGILVAAQKPGFCTCTMCQGASKKMCDDVWICP